MHLVHQFSAPHMLVTDVETNRVQDALPIAHTLLEPLKETYVEALVYFHRPGMRDRLAARRVQWTEQKGYVETNYEQ